MIVAIGVSGLTFFKQILLLININAFSDSVYVETAHTFDRKPKVASIFSAENETCRGNVEMVYVQHRK